MIDKTCLIIDDTSQSDEFNDAVTSQMKGQGYNVKFIQINTSDGELLDGDTGQIDSSLLKKKLEITLAQSIDVVATDFELSDEKINGLNVIRMIRDIRDNCKLPIILYSGKIDQVLKAIADNNPDDKIKLMDNIKQLINLRIVDFCDRGVQHFDQIKKSLKEKSNNPTEVFLKELREYGDMKFESFYTYFDGYTLQQIAAQIEKKTSLGLDFEAELIELTVAHMIDINMAKS